MFKLIHFELKLLLIIETAIYPLCSRSLEPFRFSLKLHMCPKDTPEKKNRLLTWACWFQKRKKKKSLFISGDWNPFDLLILFQVHIFVVFLPYLFFFIIVLSLSSLYKLQFREKKSLLSDYLKQRLPVFFFFLALEHLSISKATMYLPLSKHIIILT